MFERLKRQVYEMLETPEVGTPLDKFANVFIITMVLLNVVAVILETEADIFKTYYLLFLLFDIYSASVFTLEYGARLWACTENPKYSSPVLGRLRYMFSVMGLIDLLAVLPFYLQFLPALRVIRLLRVVRILRLLKLARYSDAADTLVRVIRNKSDELLITLSIGATLIIVSSTLVYYAEFEAQPEKFSSILSSMWWSVITLATVGYGDVYPVTALGKFFGALTALFGIGMFALPTALIGSGFMEELQKKRDSRKTICPHCGKDINERPHAGEQKPVAIVVQAKK
jgi:voltage-gated potassium channel